MLTPIVMMTVRVDPKMHGHIGKAAKSSHISKNSWMVQAAEEKLAREAKR